MISFQNKNGSETGAVPHISETTDSMHKATGKHLKKYIQRKRLSIRQKDNQETESRHSKKMNTYNIISYTKISDFL